MNRILGGALLGLLLVTQACAMGSGGVWQRRVSATSHRAIQCAREEASRLGYGVRGAGTSFTAEKWFNQGTEQTVGYISGYLTQDSLTVRAERRRMSGSGRFPVPQPPTRPGVSLSSDTLTRPRQGNDQLPPGVVATDAGRIVNRCRGS